MTFTKFTAKKMMASLVSIGAVVAVVGSANSTFAPLASNYAQNWELSQQQKLEWGGVGVSGLRVRIKSQQQQPQPIQEERPLSMILEVTEPSASDEDSQDEDKRVGTANGELSQQTNLEWMGVGVSGVKMQHDFDLEMSESIAPGYDEIANTALEKAEKTTTLSTLVFVFIFVVSVLTMGKAYGWKGAVGMLVFWVVVVVIYIHLEETKAGLRQGGNWIGNKASKAGTGIKNGAARAGKWTADKVAKQHEKATNWWDARSKDDKERIEAVNWGALVCTCGTCYFCPQATAIVCVVCCILALLNCCCTKSTDNDQ